MGKVGQAVVARAFNPSTREAEAGDLSLRPAWSTRASSQGRHRGPRVRESDAEASRDLLQFISPFEQRPFPNYFSKGIPNVLLRTHEFILPVAPPFVAFYLIYTWGNQEFERSRRKDPAMYENDK